MNIMDGGKCFVFGGPSNGDQAEPKVIVASTDRIAADATGVALLKSIGTEDRMGFLTFPQGGGRVRLYGGYSLDEARRFAGPDGPRRFLDAFENREGEYDHIIVLIPVIRPTKWWQRALHNQMDLVLSAALLDRPELAVARLPVTIEQLKRVELGRERDDGAVPP